MRVFLKLGFSSFQLMLMALMLMFGAAVTQAEVSKVSTLKSKKSESSNLISQVVGAAGEQIVTSREVQIVNLMEKALTDVDELRLMALDDAKFNLEITQVLLETVVLMESLVFEMNQVKDEEFKETSQKINKKLSSSADWRKLQVSQNEFEKFLKRKLIAKKFIKIKSDSMKGFISDQEAKDYFEKNRVKFGQVPFSDFKENIKTFLTQQQLEERLTAWFEVIKKKYKVKNYNNENRGQF